MYFTTMSPTAVSAGRIQRKMNKMRKKKQHKKPTNSTIALVEKFRIFEAIAIKKVSGV